MNKTVGELETLPKDFRVFILRVRRQGALLEAEPSTVIRRDDVVAVAARHEGLVARGTSIGPEVQDRTLLDIPIEVLDVVVTNKALTGKSLAELAARASSLAASSCDSSRAAARRCRCLPRRASTAVT